MAIKIVRNAGLSGLTAKQELAALQKVQQASKQLHGRRHVIQLLDSYAQTDVQTGASWMYIVTR